jgi:hypothetical protein
MFFCIEHTIFCSIVSVGQDYIIVDSNGHKYVTNWDNLIVPF